MTDTDDADEAKYYRREQARFRFYKVEDSQTDSKKPADDRRPRTRLVREVRRFIDLAKYTPTVSQKPFAIRARSPRR